MKTKEELRLYFENGDKPTQQHFWEWQDSYWHKEEKLTSDNLNLIAFDKMVYSSTDPTEVIGIGRKIIFPEGIKAIGGFMYTSASKNAIVEIILPNSLEKIKSVAFTHQYLMGTLKIPGSCKIIDVNAFFGANANLSNLILEEGIETIASNAFQITASKNLTHLHIPGSIRTVGENAFAIPSLQTVSAPVGLDLSIAGIPTTAIITYR